MDRMEEAYEHPNPLRRQIDKERIKLILKEIKENSIVLDAGCEEGKVLEQISKKALAVYGFDIKKSYIKKASEKGIEKARVLLGSVLNIPIKNDFFDAVVCTEVLEHLENPQKAVEELKRVTKKGGKIIITVPNESLVIKIKKALKALHIAKLFVLSEEKSEGHITEFDKKKAVELIEKVGGLEKEKVKRFPAWAPVRIIVVATKN